MILQNNKRDEGKERKDRRLKKLERYSIYIGRYNDKEQMIYGQY